MLQQSPPQAQGTRRLARDPLSPWRPGPEMPFDRHAAAHLARRAGFGAAPEELDQMVAAGVTATIDALVQGTPVLLQDSGTVTLPQGESLNVSTSSIAQRAQWLHAAAHASAPFVEKMALFWHDHFSVGPKNGRMLPTMVRHINVLRSFGLGSLRDLLIEVTLDPAMQLFLDNFLNGRGGQINENYSRELLELYAMGPDNGYSQTDVVEAAKCLSGWSLDRTGNPTFRAAYHIPGRKRVLGTAIDNTDGRRDLPDLIDAILARPEPARFLVEKIWRYFVDDRPDPRLLDQLADRFRATGHDIGALMDLLLRSNVFFEFSSRHALVKNPVEFTIGAIRHLGTPTIGSWRLVAVRLEQQGYPLMAYEGPNGLDDGMAWIDSQAWIARGNLADELTAVPQGRRFRAATDPLREIRRVGLGTSSAVVAHYLEHLVDGRGPAEVAAALDLFLNRDDRGPAPFDPRTPAGVAKMRGFLHLLLCLPEYQTN